jgi:hypothetical protein
MKFFVSYSHKDKALVERLSAHLAPLRRGGKATAWIDREIDVGREITPEIMRALESSDVFLACVSADYIDSDYCYERELATAHRRHDEGKMTVVPIILKPCHWTSTPLGAIKGAPEDGKAITEWANQDTAFTGVVKSIARLIDKRSPALRDKPSPQPPEAEPAAPRYRGRKSSTKSRSRNFGRDRLQRSGKFSRGKSLV